MKEVEGVSRETLQILRSKHVVRRIATLTLLAALAAGVVTQFLPRVYRASAKILPSDAGVGLPFADVLAAADLSAVLGARGAGQNPVLTYPEILLSRPVLEKTLDLRVDSSAGQRSRTVMESLRIKGKTQSIRYDRGIKELRKLVGVRPNPRSGIISITADTHDPALSAFLANGLVSNLNQFNLGVRESRSRAVREFIEGRLRETGSALERSERDFARFRGSNLRIGLSPQLVLEQERLQRQVDLQAELYRLLRRQYEQARIEEHRDTPTFTVMESAIPPVRKHRPSTILNVLSAVAGTIGLVFVLALVDPKLILAPVSRRRSEVPGG